MNMIFPFIVLFFAACYTKRTQSISNIEHVLSRVFNVTDDRCQRNLCSKDGIVYDIFW